ncbi:TadE-like protein [Panacagrimonas perspica]|uniref:TadE-like protein n=1 Tax=Panacagrimonas perspica TaxID=381431 RepID=A0A4R7NT50_9GAMM|nr:TadE family protein [Panacagrimonas perspica]TDU24255.1 TadE-like protein [Panacagrimonas perspica]
MNRRPSRQTQRGAAAVEFALAFPMMFMLLYGLLTFGTTFYAQTVVARAVHDGARVAGLVPTPPANQPRDFTRVKTEIIESLAASVITPPGNSQTLAVRRAWLESHVRSRITVVEAPCTGAIGGTCATIRLNFPYGNTDGTRLFPDINIPGIGGTGTWIPSALTSKAIVRL